MQTTIRSAVFTITLALLPAGSDAQTDRPLVHDGIVNAPLSQVWAAYTTKPGLESWLAAHAEIELKIGAAMRTQHDPAGPAGDASAIVNTILSYEPERMISFKVAKFPRGFPFPTAIKNMWTVVYFEAQGDKATQIGEVCLGFGPDAESRKMREFFDYNNAVALKLLQRKFAPPADPK